MAKKSTKNRKNAAKSRRAQRRRQERTAGIIVCAFLCICIGICAAVRIANSRGPKTSGGQWVVADGEMEILAPAAGETLDYASAGAPGEGLPFLQPTEAPEPAATPEPTAESSADTFVALPEPVIPEATAPSL